MTPDEFIRTWSGNPLTERASAQAHFIALCQLLDVEPPSPATAGRFEFEKGAAKTTGGGGWADVWREGAFAWEYKKARANLDAAYQQVRRYAPALANPPLLVVSDTQRIVIRTAFTGYVEERHDVALEDLRDGAARDLLRRAFLEPRSFRPRRTRAQLTEEAAATFAALAGRLQAAGHPPPAVAHFVHRLVFCMFAEDVRLLPGKMFEQMVFASDPATFEGNCRDLFRAMAHRGGKIGYTPIPWFNGGLFDDDAALPVDADDIAMLRRAAKMDWSQIDAALLGTLFERGLDPAKRSQLGAHYTDTAKIMQIVEPVVLRPLRAEWAAAREEIEAAMEEEREAKAEAGRTRAAAKAGALTRRANRAHERASRAHAAFLKRLRGVRVLDPACGSGNFLNATLTALRDLEHLANIEAETLGLPRPANEVGPECVLGLELNPYAAELARVSVWIADIQWERRNGAATDRVPVLRKLDTIQCTDALLEWSEDGTAAPRPWPEAEFVVGNPPFLGDRRMISELGEGYVHTLRQTYTDVRGGVDLVGYWFAKAWGAVEAGHSRRVGLVSTNSIRGGANRSVLTAPAEFDAIFEAWSDEPWTVDGAAVRVSMIMFGAHGVDEPTTLDGEPVERIASDLTGGGVDLTTAERLAANKGVSFIGTQKNGPFDIEGTAARAMIALPSNPNGRRNSDVVRPWTNGAGIVRRDPDKWIIDFGCDATETAASYYEAPFEYVREHVRPTRINLRREWHRTRWWLHGDPRPALRKGIQAFERFVVTPRVSKHRLFVWRHSSVLPDSAVVAIARDDDTTFGILHSRFHETWSLRMGTSLEDRPRYTPSTTFETFPFPEGLAPDTPATDYEDDPRARAVAEAARALDAAREAWLNPPEWVRREPEVAPGYPDRLVPVDAAAAKALKSRTLTNLYNGRPAWLAHLHDALDRAVARAYGWTEDGADRAALPDETALARLLALNRARAAR